MASAYPFTTTWTGAGDGTTWSEAANWSNGVPLNGADAPSADQDVATIDNSVDKTPFTVVIAGAQNAGEIDVDAVDPTGGVAVSLTGTLGLSINQSPTGSGFGVVDLTGGTFEIDGGTLGTGEVSQTGGTLAFGSYAKWGVDTLAGSIIDGATAIDNASTVVIQQYDFAIFDGPGGYGTPAAVTISDGSTLSVLGSLYLDGEIDVQNGTLSLDGGSLNSWGQTGTLYADGGAVNLTQDTTVNSGYTIEGGLTFTAADTLAVAAGGNLTLGNDALAAPTVVNLDGGTLDVTGVLNLDDTVLENGTLILESGSTYSIDSASSLSNVTVTDNRPPAQTSWTGAAGDDQWTNAANWSNGVPQSGLGFTTATQSLALVNNLIDTVPSTIVIAGAVNAQDITVSTTDPSNNESVSLTGTLDLSWNGEGGAYGNLNLNSGSFELDGGTLSYANIGINGGALEFAQNLSDEETLNTDIVNGTWGVYSSIVVLTGYDIVHAQGGSGPTTVTLNGGGQILVVNGTLALDGEIDVEDGADNTVLALDGGNLAGYGGDAATIFLDGGTFAIDANTTFSNAIDIYGSGQMAFGNSNSGFTLTIDASSVTTIGQAGGAETTINLNGGTIDVFGTLNLTNTYITNGTIIIEAGAIFNDDATDTLNDVTVVGGIQTATNWTGGGDGTSWSDAANWDNGVPVAGGPYTSINQNVTTIDNAHGATAPFTVVITGDQAGAHVIVNATDPSGGVAVSLQGTLNLAFDSTANSSTLGLIDLNSGTFEVDGGTLQTLNVNQNGGQITFGSAAKWGAATLNASGITGNVTIGNASDLVIAQSSFGAFNETDGTTVDDVSIQDNSTLDIKGSLSSSNNIDIYSGTVILDGGSLSMSNGAKLIGEGGGLTIVGDGTFGNVTYDGAVTIGTGNTLTIAAGDAATLDNGTNQYTVNLGGGTIDIQGSLDVVGVIENNGILDLEAGSTLTGATVNSAVQYDDPTVNINGDATFDTVVIDAPIDLAQNAVLTIAGTTTFGNAADPSPMQVNLNGGVLDVTGTLNLDNVQVNDGTIIVEAGGKLTTDATTTLDEVTLEQTLANGDLAISGENVVINALQPITTAHNIDLSTGVTAGGTATGTPGEVTFAGSYDTPVGFTGAGLITATDANGVSKTDFDGGTLDATVAGETLTFATDTYLPDYGTFAAGNGASLIIGDAAHAGANLVNGVFDGSISATGGSSVLFYGAGGIATINGQITLDASSSINVATTAGDVSLAQSITSIGSQNPTTYLDQLGTLNLDNGANFIDPNAVVLYGTINLTGGTLSTAGLTGDTVVFNYGFGVDYASGVSGYGTLDGPFGSTTGDIFMEALGGTLTYNGTVTGFDNFIGGANSTLIVNSALDTAGDTNGYEIGLDTGSTVDLTGKLGDLSNLYVNFDGSNATLVLNDPVGVTFANINLQSASPGLTNDVIDLAGLVAATGTGGAPEVTIARISDNAARVTIQVAGDPGVVDTFTINGIADTGITFNPDDGHGGSEIVTGPGPGPDAGVSAVGAPATEAVTQNSITALGGLSISEPGALSDETFTVVLSDTSGLLSATGSGVTGPGATSITLAGTLAQVNADLATVTLDAKNAGTDTLNVALTDSFGGTASQAVAINATHVPSPDLTVSSITAPASGIEGQTVQLTWTVTNSGDATATGPWTDNVYLASDAAGDTKTLVGSFTYNGTLTAGQSATETQTITVPSTFAISNQTGTASTYFVVQADPANQTGALSGFQNNLSVATTPTAVTATINWAQDFAAIMPPGFDATDYALIEQRFVSEVGTTQASLDSAVNTMIAALDKGTTAAVSASAAIDVLVDQAIGGLVDYTLAQVAAPSASSTGLDTLLTPSYSSDLVSRNNSGAFGDGWSSELNDVGPLGPMNGFGSGNIDVGSSSYVVEYIITYVDQFGDYLGQSISYQIVAPAGSDISLTDPSNPYSNYTQTNANGTIETFDGKSGFLIGISDSQGNAITINRDAAGVITGITTASGHPPTFTVNAAGNITSATDSAGHLVTYTYDASGTHLLSTTNSAGTTSYQYATSSNAFIQNALTQVTQPDGSTLAYAYNAQGDIASQSTNGAAPTTFSYASPNTITATNGDGQLTAYTYDANGKVISITDAGGGTYTFQRDASGNATSLTNPAGETYRFSYDASGNITGVIDPLGHETQATYTAGTSDLTSIADQNGNLTQYTYNAAGQVSGVGQANGSGSQYQYNAAGEVSEKIEASGATIQYTYNAAGKITNELFSDGTSQSYTYDGNGYLTSSTAVGGGVSTYAYNTQGLLASVTNAAGQVESYSYNAAGQETQRVEPDGSITNYAYTTAGQLAQITDGSGGTIASYIYDTGGVLTEKDTGNGAKTLYTYDAGGNLAEIKTLASDGSTTSKLDYTYDADNRITTATSTDGTWTYTYDAASQLTHAVFASTNAAIASQDLAYQYDAAGNRMQTIFNGATTNYTTNNLNQYTSTDGSTYSYDANGNLVTKVVGGATTSYTYNVQNQLTSSTDASGTTSYTYDALGNIATQTVGGVKTSYVSDPLAINSTATGPLSAVAQAYNASGQATATYTYGDGLTAVTNSGTTSYYNADASGNITSLSGASGALTATYAYTPTGTLINSTGSLANPFQFNGQAGALTQSNGLVATGVRYYDPTTGRFTTEDPTGQAGGINLYTYAGNNPVNYIDASGNSISLAGVASGLFGLVATVVSLPEIATVGAVLLVGGAIVGSVATINSSLYQDGTADLTIHQDTPAEKANALIGAAFSAGGALLKGGAALYTNIAGLYNSAGSLTDTYNDVLTRLLQFTHIIDVPQGGGHGDVHLITFDGLHYDFQAVGEFVLAKSTVADDSFQVQVRLAPYGGGDNAPTVTTEIGVQVGTDKVTFGVDRTATVWVDGVASTLSATANTLTLAGGTISELSQDTYQVTEKTGEVVDITDDGSYLGYTVDLAPTAKPGSVEGLLGSYTGTANAFELPDGTVLGSSLTSVQLYQTFGNAWRITDATSLLDYGTGETTATYTDTTHPAYGLPVSSLPTAVVTAATAAVAAAGITDPTAAADAAYDYLVTGDPSFITNAAASGAQAPVTSNAVITQVAPVTPPPPSIGISPVAPMVTEVSGQTPVTFTVSLTSVATASTVVDYTVASAALDAGKTYFDAGDFGGTLPSGTLTILAGQSTAQITVNVPNSALGTDPGKWLAVSISTPGADPIYATTAQVDILNDAPVAGVAAQPVLEYVPGNAAGATQYTPTLTQTGNSYTLNLGNVVQGTSVAALQFALANMASAPADSVNAAVVGAYGSFRENGLTSATVITAGGSYSGLNVQPLTTNLGAQSESVTIAAQDVNETGYSGALPNITLNVTENVIAAAQATINTTAIALPDARVGSTDTQTITVTNTATSGAAPLDVTLGAAAGAAATGSIAQLATGDSDSTSLAVGLATTTAGLQASFVTLNLASDLGSGVETPLALNQSVAVTGSVYRPANATVTQPTTIVHVGDPASQILSILNADPADGYSEGLRATVTGVTGNISASGTTGLIAAGTTDASSVSVSYSTAAPGVVSGQVDLGLTSDGTGVDSLAPISLGTDVVPFSVQVDNYATADLHEISGGGTLTGSAATGYVLDLGTIGQGTGPATIDLAALNSASGLADLLSGSFGITGNTASLAAFTNTGFGTFSGLGAGQSDGALSVSLSTLDDGTFSETITLSAAGSNASGYSGAVAPVTLTIHGQVATNTPVLAGGTVVTGGITELAGTTGSASLDTAQGSIAYTDANLSSTHAASVTGVAATGVTTGLPGNAALLSLLSLGTLSEDTASTPGSVAWNFAAADSTFDYLAAGETLTLTYAVSIAEVGGNSVTQDVTVTVTGTNDLPVIASGTTASASIPAIVAGATTPANDTASGVIRFSDADIGDTHTATVASVTSSGLVAGLPGNATLLALLATTAVTEQAGATAGSVGWNFTAPDATFAYLTPGQSVTLTYAIDVSDNHGGTAVQDVTVTITGGAGTVSKSAASGTFFGVNYASSAKAYTAAGVFYQETYYNASGNVVASESVATNGSYVITLGGVVYQSKTFNSDGSYVVFYDAGGTFVGTTYANVKVARNAAGSLTLQTYYDAGGNVVASESYTASGGYTITLGASVYQVKTVNSDGSYDFHTYAPGTFQGTAYTDYDNAYNASGMLDMQTFYGTGGTVVASESHSANGSYVITLGGVVYQSKTFNPDGSYVVFYDAAGTFVGTAYANVKVARNAAGSLTLQTYYDAGGNVVASESYTANGGYTITLGASVYQAKTVNSDGSYDFHTSAPGTFQGTAYTDYDYAYNASGMLDMQTFYGTGGTVVASESHSANGSYVITLGGVVYQSKTFNTDGSYVVFYDAAGTFVGTAYASVNIARNAAGSLTLQTYYDAGGNVVASESYTANGGYTITLGASVYQVKTVNSDGSFDFHTDTAGTFRGTAYASFDNAYTKTGVLDMQTYYDAGGNVVASESYTANGGYTITIGNVVHQIKTINADGSYLIVNENVQGQGYTQSQLAYTASGTLIATSETLTSGTNTTSIGGVGLTLTNIAGVETVSNGADTFQLGADTHGSLNIAGAANATLAFGTGDGAQIISGFATSGAGADVLSFSSAVFADYAHLLGATRQQGSDLLITLDPNDTLLLKNVSMSSFTSSNAHFT